MNVIDLLTIAKENNGCVPLDVSMHYNGSQLKDRLIEFFNNELENQDYFIAPLVFSKSNILNENKKSFLNSVVKNIRNKEYIDMYSLLQIPEEKQVPHSFDIFINFFICFRTLALREYMKVYVKFLYESNPDRIEIVVGFKNKEGNNYKDDKLTDYLNNYVKNVPLISNWLSFIAKTLKEVGMNSVYNLKMEGFLTIEEKYSLFDKYMKENEQ